MVERKTSTEGKALLKKILAQPGNDRCADCKTATHPRWASYNLGVLICIRCSGIHRSLGTHISKVRSIDLDFWTDEQIASLAGIGNRKANEYWEAHLPANYVPDESKIMNYVRTKYELKRWVKDGGKSRSSSLDEDAPLSAVKQSRLRDGPPTMPPKVRQGTQSHASVDLLDFSGYSDSKLASRSSAPVISSTSASAVGSGTSRYSDAPTSTSRHPSHHHHSHQHHQQQQHRAQPRAMPSRTPTPNSAQAPAPASAQTENRDSLKKSILSLYAKPASSTPSPVARPATSAPPATTTAAPSAYQSTQPMDNIGALSGLNFGGQQNRNNQTRGSDPFKTVQPQVSQTAVPSPVPSPVPSLPRSSASVPPAPTKTVATVAETVDDDDELFKNVWA